MPKHGDIYNCYNGFLGIVMQQCVTRIEHAECARRQLETFTG